MCVTTGFACTSFPPADYPRQLVTVRALDAEGKVATGYNGTVTFTNPAFSNGNGGLADSKLDHGIGVFPVLEPRLKFTPDPDDYPGLCQQGGGIALVVRDTVNPTINGCTSIQGGSITLVHPEVYEDVSVPSCSSDCLQEPTNTIIIDPSFANPVLQSVETGQIFIAGGTSAEQWYIQPVEVAYFVVPVASIGGVLDVCTQCTQSTRFYARQSELDFNVLTPVDYRNEQTHSDGATYADLDDVDLDDEIGFDFGLCAALGEFGHPCDLSGAQAVLTNSFGPTCYDTAPRIYQVACLGG